jgi:hypothetical protein
MRADHLLRPPPPLLIISPSPQAKAALVMPATAERPQVVWHDGSDLNVSRRPQEDPPPPLMMNFHRPQGCVSYFEEFRRHPQHGPGTFTDPEQPGSIYRPAFDAMFQALKWTHKPCPHLAPDGHHFLLPAFFHTLRELARVGRSFSLVFRTFGTDLPEVMRAVMAFAAGHSQSTAFFHFNIYSPLSSQ